MKRLTVEKEMELIGEFITREWATLNKQKMAANIASVCTFDPSIDKMVFEFIDENKEE